MIQNIILMKTLQKQPTIGLPKAKFIEKDLSGLFVNGYEPFAEKTARAKEAFKNIKLPPR